MTTDFTTLARCEIIASRKGLPQHGCHCVSAGRVSKSGETMQLVARTIRTLAILLATGTSIPGVAHAQAAAAAVPQGLTWDQIKSLPDWSGTWQAVSFKKHMIGSGRAPYRDLFIPFNPTAEIKFKKYQYIAFHSGVFPSRSDHCTNYGFPGDMDHPFSVMQFLYTPGQVTLSAASFTRRIYTDGRPHDDSIVTFQGDSIGHWEPGGVLVVDTTDLDPGDEFILGYAQGNNSHGTERIHLQDKVTLVDDVTLEAPDILLKPYKYQIVYKRSKFPVQEYDCAQGNRESGPDNQTFDLTPPQQ